MYFLSVMFSLDNFGKEHMKTNNVIGNLSL